MGKQTRIIIAGIAGVPATGDAVVVSKTGQLGIVVSSARYKHDISDIGDRSSRLLKLRPVSFRYKNKAAGTLQYGLIAEEVAKIYPELVTFSPDGKAETVPYLTMIAMLLNELQKHGNQLHQQMIRNDSQARQINLLNPRITEVEASDQRELQARLALENRLSMLERTPKVQEQKRIPANK
ncbi:MAG TPA: tail fiber domain-containing protein [Candidatus Binataceae bacterium]|nr:tail fiber domain-containing protein [Candidatus Binataceae bacterium]